MTLQCLHNKVLTFCLKNMLQRHTARPAADGHGGGSALRADSWGMNRRLETGKQAHACGQPRNALTANTLQKAVF